MCICLLIISIFHEYKRYFADFKPSYYLSLLCFCCSAYIAQIMLALVMMRVRIAHLSWFILCYLYNLLSTYRKQLLCGSFNHPPFIFLGILWSHHVKSQYVAPIIVGWQIALWAVHLLVYNPLLSSIVKRKLKWEFYLHYIVINTNYI